MRGRAESFKILEDSIDPTDKTVWFHCASLGEYEQGLPVFKKLRTACPNHKIVLTFFSPSGYDIKKNAEVADVVVYLPLDTSKSAMRFVNQVSPELTIFVKYDIWPNYLNELQKNGLKAYLISATFRPQQLYFKWYGQKFKRALHVFEHIFVQNSESKKILQRHHFNKVTVSGDTRFDRVANQLTQNNRLPLIEEFKQNSICIVIGSSWPADEAVLIPYINEKASSLVKFITAPHEIKKNNIKRLSQQIGKPSVLYSEISEEMDQDQRNNSGLEVLIIDNVGILSKIYSYADIAYVGGAMGTTGLHNILEPAVFGVPILIGKNHKKFPEATEMIEKAGVTSISNFQNLKSTLDRMISDESYRESEGTKNHDFIQKNRGAVVQIIQTLRI